MDRPWKTWWFHAEPPTEALAIIASQPPSIPRAIVLDGSENAHWRFVARTPCLIPDAVAIPALGCPFKDWLLGRDVSEYADDWEDRERMKHTTFAAGWMRAGLVDGKVGYLDALRANEAPLRVRRAAQALLALSGGMMTTLDLLPIHEAWSGHWGRDRDSDFLRLEGEALSRFLHGRHAGAVRAFLPL